MTRTAWRVRRPVGLVVPVALLFGLLPPPLGAGEPDKNDPARPVPATEEQTLKEALEHLRQFADLAQRLREAKARAQCADNLRQINVALQKYDEGRLPAMPPAWPVGQPGQNGLPQILPYIEQDNLYRTWMTPDARGGLGRLGLRVETPNETLAQQIDLPKGEGLVVSAVTADSTAARAGVQAHDILLQFHGKPVPRDPAEFARLVEGVKPKTPVDAVVLRKGKNLTVKGLTLPEPPANSAGIQAVFGDGSVRPVKVLLCPSDITDGTSNTLILGERLVGWGGGWGASPVLTTTFRRDDRFTTRYQEGSLIITVTGKIADGKASAAQVKVQDGGVEHQYPSLDRVPPEYQDKARDLLEVSEKGQGKIDIKK
jgi:hypothetical protein